MKVLKLATILACSSVAHLTAMEKHKDQQVHPLSAPQMSQGPSLLDAYLLLTLLETPLPVVDAMDLDEPHADGILRETDGKLIIPVPAKVPGQEEWDVIEEGLLDPAPSAAEQLHTTDRASLPLRVYEVKVAQQVDTLGIQRTDLLEDEWKELAKRLKSGSQYTFSTLATQLRYMAKNKTVTQKNKEIYTNLSSASDSLYFQSIDKTKRLSEPLRNFEGVLAAQIKSLGIQEIDLDKERWNELAYRLHNISKKALSTLESQLNKMAKNHTVTDQDKRIYRILSRACCRLYHLKFPDGNDEPVTTTQQHQDHLPVTIGVVEDAMDLDVRDDAEEREDKNSDAEKGDDKSGSSSIPAIVEEIEQGGEIVSEEALVDVPPSAKEQLPTTDRASLPFRDYEMKVAQLVETLGIQETNLHKDEWKELAKRLKSGSQYTFSTLVTRLRYMAKNKTVTQKNKEIYTNLSSASHSLYFQSIDKAKRRSEPLRGFERVLADQIKSLGIQETNLHKDEWKELAKRLKSGSQYTFSTLVTRLRYMAKNKTVTQKNKEIYTNLSSASHSLYFQSIDKAKRRSEPLRGFERVLADQIKSLGIQETDLGKDEWNERAIRLKSIAKKAFTTLDSQLSEMARNQTVTDQDKHIYKMLSSACYTLYRLKFPDGNEEPVTTTQQHQAHLPVTIGVVEDAMDLDISHDAEEREDKNSESEDYDQDRLVPLEGRKTELSRAGFTQEPILTYLDKESFREFMLSLDAAFAKLTLGCSLKNFEQHADALSDIADFEYHKLCVFVGTSKRQFSYVYKFPYVMDTDEELLLHYHPRKNRDEFANWTVLSPIVKAKNGDGSAREKKIKDIVEELGLVQVHDNLKNVDWEQHLKLIAEQTLSTIISLRPVLKKLCKQAYESKELNYYTIFQKLMNATERLYTQELKSAPLLPHQQDLLNHLSSLQINVGDHDAETWKKWATTLQEKTGKGFGTLGTQLRSTANNSHVLEPFKSIYFRLANACQKFTKKQQPTGVKRKRSEDADSFERDLKRQRKE